MYGWPFIEVTYKPPFVMIGSVGPTPLKIKQLMELTTHQRFCQIRSLLGRATLLILVKQEALQVTSRLVGCFFSHRMGLAYNSITI